MLNKKLEITLGGEVVQLWFNLYAVSELQKLFGVEQGEITQKVIDRAKDNYLLLIVDLIKVGIKGHALAKGEKSPDILKYINEIVAISEMSDLVPVWEVFNDVMGGNVPKDDKKK
jgi:hypothetical protein